MVRRAGHVEVRRRCGVRPVGRRPRRGLDGRRRISATGRRRWCGTPSRRPAVAAAMGLRRRPTGMLGRPARRLNTAGPVAGEVEKASSPRHRYPVPGGCSSCGADEGFEVGEGQRGGGAAEEPGCRDKGETTDQPPLSLGTLDDPALEPTRTGRTLCRAIGAAPHRSLCIEVHGVQGGPDRLGQMDHRALEAGAPMPGRRRRRSARRPVGSRKRRDLDHRALPGDTATLECHEGGVICLGKPFDRADQVTE